MDIKYIGLAVVGVIAGSLLASWILPLIPFALDGWMQGVLIGIIQVVILIGLGVVASRGIFPILIGGLVIFVGGIIGGFISGYLGFTDWYATILIAFVQVVALMLAGFVKGSKAAIPLAGKVK